MAPVTRKALVGLFLFSALFTTGASLECETCLIIGNSCVGSQMTTCPMSNATCMTLVYETTGVGSAGSKSCYSKAACEKLKTEGTYTDSGTTFKIKELTCKAPSPSASLLLALAGFLLLKVIF